MKKPFGILLITLGLLLDAGYLFYRAFNPFLVITFIWAGVALVAAYGIFNLKPWSQYLIFMLTVFGIANWVDGTIQSFAKGWPDAEPIVTILSFLPSLFFIGPGSGLLYTQ